MKEFFIAIRQRLCKHDYRVVSRRVFIEPDEEHITATLYECCKCGLRCEEVKV